MCGKKVMDTSMYASGQLWDGSEKMIKDAIAKVDEEVQSEKKRKRSRGLQGAGLFPDGSAAQAAGAGGIFPAQSSVTENAQAASISVTFGQEGSLGIVFSDEGWEIQDISIGGTQALCVRIVRQASVDDVRSICADLRALAISARRACVRDGGAQARSVSHTYPR